MDVIGLAHALLAKRSPHVCLGIFAGRGVSAKIRAALAAHPPPWQQRASPLHPVLVTWLQLGMALFRSLSIPNVFAHLMDGLRDLDPGFPLRPVTEGALAHARARLGAAPLRALFERMADDVRPGPSFHGLRVWAIDGTVLSVPDTEPNEAHFGRHVASRGRSAFPQLRLMTLVSALTHQVRAADWCRYDISEVRAAKPLLQRMRPGDLLLLDRGLGSIEVASQLAAQGAKFLYRVRSALKPKVLYERGPGDCQVLVKVRVKGADGSWRKIVLEARMITYRVDKDETVRLLTNIDDAGVSTMDLARFYHERWEVELGYDEIKTHLGSTAKGTLATTFRGRSGPMVEQEIWATLALYNMVRETMADAGSTHGIDPRRIGFVAALETVRLAVPRAQGCHPKVVLARYVQLMGDLADCILDRWRRPRAAPRAVRVKEGKYRSKKPHERCSVVDRADSITLGAA